VTEVPENTSEELSSDESSVESPAEVIEIAPLDPLEAAQAEAAQLKDKLMRMAADFDNYRKRSRREISEAERKGRDGLLTDLLPVFDNLERATSHAGAAGEAADPATIRGLVDGIALVARQFKDALGRLGIERVESIGQPFDPSVHEAIQHLETTEFPPGCVAAEVQPGYRFGDRLIRPAMVVVAKAPAVAQDDSQEN
jgi:molecular chaperone GrpE